jgi:hypothetical protein
VVTEGKSSFEGQEKKTCRKAAMSINFTPVTRKFLKKRERKRVVNYNLLGRQSARRSSPWARLSGEQRWAKLGTHILRVIN